MRYLSLARACVFSISSICLSAPALADFDFSGSISSPVVISNVAGSQGYKSIHFQIKINNAGSSNFHGSLKLKPFTVVADGKFPLAADSTGAVLDTMSTGTINIASNGSTTVSYNATLPLMRLAPYALAVFINNDMGVAETNTLDNVTDLVKLPAMEVLSAPATPGNFDLSAKFDGELTLSLGGISDLIRTIVHGAYTSFPGAAGTSRDLWARFMLMDLNTNKVHTTPYINYGGSSHTTCLNQPNTDKQWFAISYSHEKDEEGNPIYVDYYQQAPCFEDTAPGDYLFVELLNSRDLVRESNVHNDINMLPVSLTPVSTSPVQPEVWMVHADNTPTVAQVFSFHANYMKRDDWNLTFDGNLAGLSADATSGSVGGVSGSTYGHDLTLHWTPTPDQTALTGNLNLGFSAYPQNPASYPVRLFNFAPGTAPVLSVPTPSVTVTINHVPQKVAGRITFLNTGSTPLQWKAAPAVTWVKLVQTSGTTAPQGATVLDFEVDAGRVQFGGAYSTSIMLMNNSTDTYHSLPIQLNWVQ